MPSAFLRAGAGGAARRLRGRKADATEQEDVSQELFVLSSK